MPDKVQHFSMPNLDTTPPGSWRFLVKETGKRFTHYVAFAALIRDLKKHYKSNEIPEPVDLEQQVIDQICPDLPPGWCEYAGAPYVGNELNRAITFTDVLSGTKTLLSWTLAGRPKVSQDEANKRASICAKCTLNVQPHGCPNCNSPLHAAVNAFVGAGRTADDANLRACKVCGCSLKAKVWFPLDVLYEHMPVEQQALFPHYCWLARNPQQPE